MASLAASSCLDRLLIGGKVAVDDKLRRDEVAIGLPTILGNHVYVILHGVGPVAHQVLVYIVFIDQTGFGKYAQDILGECFDQLFGVTAHAEALERGHVARLPLLQTDLPSPAYKP